MEQSFGIMKAAVRLLSDTMDFTDVVAVCSLLLLLLFRWGKREERRKYKLT